VKEGVKIKKADEAKGDENLDPKSTATGGASNHIRRDFATPWRPGTLGPLVKMKTGE